MTVTVQASEINQDSNQEILLTEEKSASRSIPNAVSVIVKKVDSNSVRVFFSNIGVDRVDSAVATLLLVQSNGIPVTHTYTATDLKPFVNQSFKYYSANWISAQIINAVAVDGGETGTISNSAIIYND